MVIALAGKIITEQEKISARNSVKIRFALFIVFYSFLVFLIHLLLILVYKPRVIAMFQRAIQAKFSTYYCFVLYCLLCTQRKIMICSIDFIIILAQSPSFCNNNFIFALIFLFIFPCITDCAPELATLRHLPAAAMLQV